MSSKLAEELQHELILICEIPWIEAHNIDRLRLVFGRACQLLGYQI